MGKTLFLTMMLLIIEVHLAVSRPHYFLAHIYWYWQNPTGTISKAKKKIYPPSPSPCENSKQTKPWYRTFVNKMKTVEKELQSNMVAEGWDIIPTIRANSPYSMVTMLSIYNVDDTNTKICTKNSKKKSFYPIFFGCRRLKLVCL